MMFTAQPRSTPLSSEIQHVFTVRSPVEIMTTRRKISSQISRFKVKAVIQSGNEEKKKTVESGKLVEKSGEESNGFSGKGVRDVKAVITLRKKMKEKISEKIEDQWVSLMNGIGRGILIQLISQDIDPVTKSGKYAESYVRGWFSKPSDHPYIVEYAANFTVPHDFGCPGAIIITNLLDKEIHLVQIVVHGFNEGPLFFSVNTWIHSQKDSPESRIIFQNQAYLPSQTPPGIKDLRREDLLSIRGNGKGERKLHERVYDYDVYNDLGNPDKSEDLARPLIGGQERPYPRRCRTGRGPTKKGDRFAWLRDNEFSRQALAGVNPVNIELLREFPIVSKLDPAVYGPPDSAVTRDLIEQELNGLSVEKAIEEKRLFILDYHDMLLPFIGKMNSLLGRKAYASRTLFFYTSRGVLKPIIIELSLPPTPSSPRNKRIFSHGHDATNHWIWNLAKAHVCSNDAGIHQLVNHWLRTHACMEPYIIATHRHLSSMHPIYKLLHPHMRYTLEINALARQSLINGGGVIEACFSPGKYSMEISSAAYKSMWQFDMEALPADLIRRGMAVEDPSMPLGVKLVIEDYPYAADGLLIWSAIKEYVESYVEHYYSEPNSVTSDVELQGWWNEIKNKGHPDKKNEPWWPKLVTKEDLSGILTTMIWIASGQHAAINFGQYPFGGYVPNRPTLMRKLIPHEDDPSYENFILHPEYTFLASLPTQLQATKVMAVQDTLSTHSADEEYMCQLHEIQRFSIYDHEVLKVFERFSAKLKEIENTINQRNKDIRLKNRSGAGVPPYELLLPTSGPGVTCRGIPNSISI
ncbi:lipoxygenase 6, chloroplastic isoform X3 [Capsicum annuum]|uniref:lipoxygenase 6, chloroplastic isoform X3 n=1 Tax=Capsicum annuum TaxID=4072 RepID=UPI001FB07A3A|nr:lipoxygenase 6, chloroplastic isoform X3 [Capsicum annuum]